MVDNYSTIYMNLPCKVKGFTVYNSCEDYYTIVLNSRLSYYQNIQAYFHELEHIECDDFNNNMPVTLLEQIRHA